MRRVAYDVRAVRWQLAGLHEPDGKVPGLGMRCRRGEGARMGRKGVAPECGGQAEAGAQERTNQINRGRRTLQWFLQCSSSRRLPHPCLARAHLAAQRQNVHFCAGLAVRPRSVSVP